MPISTVELLDSYISHLARPVAQGGIGLEPILGYPTVGRTAPALPMAALVVQSDDAISTPSGPRPALGRVEQQGTEVRANLMLYARSEREMLGLRDRLRQAKRRTGGLTIGTTHVTVRYSATQRVDPSPEEIDLQHVAVAEVVFTWMGD